MMSLHLSFGVLFAMLAAHQQSLAGSEVFVRNSIENVEYPVVSVSSLLKLESLMRLGQPSRRTSDMSGTLIGANMNADVPLEKADIEKLRKELKDPSYKVRRDAVLALERTGDVAVVSDMIHLIPGERNADVLLAALHAIARFGAKSKGAIPVVVELLEKAIEPSETSFKLGVRGGLMGGSSDPYHASMEVLYAIGADAMPALTTIFVSESKPIYTRLLSGQCLKVLMMQGGKIPPDDIRTAQRSPIPEVRKLAQELLGGAKGR
jgi:HEAT repeat protein